jgi:hypothetical protein
MGYWVGVGVRCECVRSGERGGETEGRDTYAVLPLSTQQHQKQLLAGGDHLCVVGVRGV